MNQRIEGVGATVAEQDMKFNLIDEKLSKKRTYKVMEKEHQERKRWILKDQQQERGVHRVSLCITLNGWVDWQRKIVTMMGIVVAGRMVTEILDNLRTHRRRVIDEKTTLSDLSELVRHMTLAIKL